MSNLELSISCPDKIIIKDNITLQTIKLKIPTSFPNKEKGMYYDYIEIINCPLLNEIKVSGSKRNISELKIFLDINCPLAKKLKDKLFAEVDLVDDVIKRYYTFVDLL